MERICPGCGGKGTIKCPVCGGDGVVKKRGVAGELGLRSLREECRACQGTGRLLCEMCGGVGKILTGGPRSRRRGWWGF